MKQRTFYYNDLKNDDFAGTKIEKKELKENFKYDKKNIFFSIFSFIIYHLIARPLLYLILKIGYGQKIINRKALKKIKGGAFLYGNHTQVAGDAFIPNALGLVRRNYIIVNNDAFALPCLNTILSSIGAVPLSDNLKHKKAMIRFINQKIKDGKTVTIYPEAHIWPYYTKIRPFDSASFKYAVRLNAPCYSFTNCYQKRKFFKKPKTITVISGPFYPDNSLDAKSATEKLRNDIYDSMVENASNYSNYEYYTYIKKEPADDKAS